MPVSLPKKECWRWRVRKPESWVSASGRGRRGKWSRIPGLFGCGGFEMCRFRSRSAAAAPREAQAALAQLLKRLRQPGPRYRASLTPREAASASEHPIPGPRVRPAGPALPFCSRLARGPLSILGPAASRALRTRRRRSGEARRRGSRGPAVLLRQTPPPSRAPRPLPGGRPPLTRVRRAPAPASRTLPGTRDT